MLLVLALASLGMGYGLWSKVLTIDGTVNTGEVNADFSLKEIDQSFDFNARCPPGVGGLGYSLGKDCDDPPDGSVYDDMEVEGKDIAECTAVLLPGLPNEGNQLMEVTITDAYPSFNCFIRYDVHNNGTIPIKVHSPEYFIGAVSYGSAINTAELHVNAWPTCYTNDVQLETSQEAICDLHVHLNQDAEQGATYTFNVKIFVHQWNEEPAP